MKVYFISIVFMFLSPKQDAKKLVIFANTKDNLIANLSINKDSTGLSFGIYVNGYENPKKRQEAVNKRNERLKNKNTDYVHLPTFAVGFIGFTKPETVNVFKEKNAISIDEFSKRSDIKITSPTYIIFKQPDGSYLKWKVFVSNVME